MVIEPSSIIAELDLVKLGTKSLSDNIYAKSQSTSTAISPLYVNDEEDKTACFTNVSPLNRLTMPNPPGVTPFFKVVENEY